MKILEKLHNIPKKFSIKSDGIIFNVEISEVETINSNGSIFGKIKIKYGNKCFNSGFVVRVGEDIKSFFIKIKKNFKFKGRVESKDFSWGIFMCLLRVYCDYQPLTEEIKVLYIKQKEIRNAKRTKG